jgi:hypothetical protein
MENLDSNDDNLFENKKSLFPLNEDNEDDLINENLNNTLDFSLFNNDLNDFKYLFNFYNSLTQTSSMSHKNFLEFLKKANLISSNFSYENTYNNYNNNNNNQLNLNLLNNSSTISNFQVNNFSKNNQLGFDLLKYFNNKETSDIIINVQGVPFYAHRVNKI